MTSNPDHLLQRLARICRRLDQKTGDRRFRAAADALEGGTRGRPAANDAAALEYASALVRSGVARSIYQACQLAAVMYAPTVYVDAMRDRLRRKLRTKCFVRGQRSGDAATSKGTTN